MARIKDTKSFMRIVHRYLGYFMAGIMVVYALSGIVLIYRDTDFLKRENHYSDTLKTALSAKEVGQEIKIKELEFTSTKGDTGFFKQGYYIASSGIVDYSKKELPYFIGQMANLHKSKSAEPLSPLNVVFGVSLFFFVISSFWMFPPKSRVFKKGMVYTAVGLVLALVLLFV